jgi:hypothetical protein
MEEKRMSRKFIGETEFEDVNCIELMVGFNMNAAGYFTSLTTGFNKLVLDHYSIVCCTCVCSTAG